MNWPRLWIISVVPLTTHCVPNETSDGKQPYAISTPTVQKWRPHSAVHALVTAQPVTPPPATAQQTTEQESAESTSGDFAPLLTQTFTEHFSEATLGSHWHTTSGNWQIQGGQLCGQRNKNHPVWLKDRLPRNARIEFTAQALSEFGDLKVEAWGDGKSYAKGNSYTDATSYIFVFGGWKNQFHVLARINEHGPNRLEIATDIDASDLKRLPVVQNKKYRMTIERKDGRTVTWRVDDQELFRFPDPEPLFGERHDRFGFNDWDTPVCFDDLTITPLSE